VLGFKIDSMLPMSSKLSTKERNDRIWETHKNHIRNVYMEKDHTLKQTMKVIQETYRFKARSVTTHLYHDFLFGLILKLASGSGRISLRSGSSKRTSLLQT
jgi:hypothetical protein